MYAVKKRASHSDKDGNQISYWTKYPLKPEMESNIRRFSFGKGYVIQN